MIRRKSITQRQRDEIVRLGARLLEVEEALERLLARFEPDAFMDATIPEEMKGPETFYIARLMDTELDAYREMLRQLDELEDAPRKSMEG